MQLACPACAKTVEYSGDRPRFCGFCGQALGTPRLPSLPGCEQATVAPDLEIDSGIRTAQLPNEADTVAATAAILGDSSGRVPETIGGYRLRRRLGGGGMGAVYEAEEPASGRRVALKLVLPEFAGSADTLLRFRQEGRLASSLAHPRCVFVLAADEEQGQPYIVMELMPGATLDDLVRDGGPLSAKEAVGKVLDVIDGLAEAHRLGLVHRDVKPSNCFIEANGRVKIGDFGLARSLVGNSKLTRTGAFVGTPLYAAPEQIHKKEATDAQSDIYSVAATLYFLLTGRAPFQTGDSMATLARIITEDAPSMRSVRPGLPRALDKVVLRGLERDRRRRYKNLDEFRRALLPFLPARPSAVGLGLRFVAYLIDVVLLMAPTFAASLAIHWFGPYSSTVTPVVLGYASGFANNLAYFGILEGWLGWSLGKGLLRVRVGLAETAHPPGIGRAMLRIGSLYLLYNLGSYLAYALLMGLSALPQERVKVAPEEGALLLAGIGLFSMGWLVLAVVATVCTMRAHNGFRGLHEFISGTHTYQLTWPSHQRRRAVEIRAFGVPTVQPEGLPERVGAFQVHGALRWTDGERTLRAADPQLGRSIWLWMRRADQPLLGAAERDIGRGTRIRWVACGSDGSWHWEAFLAPAGMPLTVRAATQPRLTWADVRPMLEELADEMAASCADGTLPRSLSVEQVWVQPDGRVQILTAPLLEPEIPTLAAAACEAGNAVDDQPRALRFLREVAVTALEGACRPIARKGDRVRASLPPHANLVLDGLFGGPQRYRDVEEFQQELTAVRDRPAEVTRARRAGHLLLTFALLNMPIGNLIFLTVTAALHLLWTYWEPALHREPDSFSGHVVLIVGCCAVWVVWAFAFRGGFAYWRGGIALRRGDGSKASRLQCALRALLVWAPVATLLCLSLAVAATEPALPWLYLGLCGLGILLLPVYAALALIWPARLLHDWIVGTYAVPG